MPAIYASKELVTNASGVRVNLILSLHPDLVHAADAIRTLEISEDEGLGACSRRGKIGLHVDRPAEQAWRIGLETRKDQGTARAG
jgi:hypothetical protein